MPSSSTSPAIVTGAAGGMGAAIAHELARQHRPLILADLDAAELATLAEALSADTEVRVVAGDLTTSSYRAELLRALDGRPLGLLVHAAGVSPTMADGRRVFAVNFTATEQLVSALLPQLAPGGVAILIASSSGQLFAGWLVDRVVRGLLAGRTPWLARLLVRDSRLAYALSKRAVQLYAAHMAPAFGARGARIVSLSPGLIDTRMGQQERDAGPGMDRMLALTPAGRMGHAREIASAVVFLASESASYIHGTDILVDGGTTAGISAAGGLRALRAAQFK
jgi:NAD(P)-dependent dehydrogenase (short-subunit alcohol dehydrogenase family)